MIDLDHTSPEAYLVFEVTFPFRQHDLSDDTIKPITDNKLYAYKCGLIVLDKIILEFSKLNVEIPDHYHRAYEYIYLTIKELS
jgi:hypothetical protein